VVQRAAKSRHDVMHQPQADAAARRQRARGQETPRSASLIALPVLLTAIDSRSPPLLTLNRPARLPGSGPGVQEEVQRHLPHRRGGLAGKGRRACLHLPLQRQIAAVRLGLEQQPQVLEILGPQGLPGAVQPVLVQHRPRDIAQMPKTALHQFGRLAHDIGPVGIGADRVGGVQRPPSGLFTSCAREDDSRPRLTKRSRSARRRSASARSSTAVVIWL
jgi:hypothetical protein